MTGPYVRVDVWTLNPSDPIIVGYAAAVSAMQGIATTSPLSWAYQAAIHGTTSTPNQPLWNQCQHGSWHFLSWHRMFLHFFERIARAHVVACGGPENWALPYWNYDGGGNYNTLPPAFRNATSSDGTPNPLYVGQRGAGINSGAGLQSAVTSPSTALACASFTGTSEFGGGIAGPLQFSGEYGQLELTPHNAVHGAIGGWMNDIRMAAQDPIFWLHHANIDRLWWLWGEGHSVPADAAWANQSFSFFDADESEVALVGKDVVDTITQLGYTYDHVPPPSVASAQRLTPVTVNWPPPWPKRPQSLAAIPPTGPGPIRHLIGASGEPVRLVGEPVEVTVPVDEASVQELMTSPVGEEIQRRAFVEIDDIEAEHAPDLVYGVYVNLPSNPSDAELASDHVGNLPFFGIELSQTPVSDRHAHGLHVTLEITGLLDSQVATGRWQNPNEISVAFRPLTLEAPPDHPEIADEIASPTHLDNPVTIGRVSLRLA